MRLLYLCSDFGIDPQGTKGASIHLRSITRALVAAGHDVRLLSPKGGPGNDHPARVLVGVEGGPAQAIGKLLKNWLVTHGLSDSPARELRPLMYNAWACEPALAALRDDPPDAIVERLSLFGHVGVDLAEALDVPLIIEMNAPLAEEAQTHRALHLGTLAHQIEQRVLRSADAIAVVSQGLAQRLMETGIEGSKVHVIPNGADPSTFEAASSRESSRLRWGLNGAVVVGFVGSLKPWHGVDVLLSAFHRLRREEPRTRLLIVGDGPSASSLRAKAVELDLGTSVIFAGAVPHEEIPRVLEAVDIAAAPFVDAPGFYFSPIKMYEYMASGLCVAASRLGQLAEVIDDGVNGLLCKPGDPQSLYQALRKAQSDPELRRRLGAAARDTVRSRYTWSHTAEALTQVIECARSRRSHQRVHMMATS